MCDIYRNFEGYKDPTAGLALKGCIKDEQEVENEKNQLIKVLKYMIDKAGFELVGRIQIRHRLSGKEFR